MADFETALRTLREARDALAATDVAGAEAALGAHDAAVRAACEAGALAVSEMEALAIGHRELLEALAAVQRGVSGELSQMRKGGAAARAYLGTAGA
jgi:hypothetical protein